MSTPNTRTRAATIVNGPNPRAVAYVGAQDIRNGLALAGLLGRRIIGMKGNPYAGSFRGDLGPLQTFKGWHPPIQSLIPGAPMSMPMTGAPDTSSGVFKAQR